MRNSGIVAVIDYAVFALLVLTGVPYLLASGIGHVVSLVFLFFSRREGKRMRAPLVPLLQALPVLLCLSIMKTSVSHFSVSPWIMKAPVAVFALFLSNGIRKLAECKDRIPAVFTILRSRVFLAMLALKIAASLLFGSDYLVKGTIPFVKYFVSSGFQNPYDFFLGQELVKAFPYSPAMLLLISLPFYLLYGVLDFNWMAVTSLDLLLARIPLLLADIGICAILLLMLKGREKAVLWFYWCSPIVLYISYIHGQLDSIPIFFLLVAVYLLLLRKEALSAGMLGIGLACKANIFIAVPFIFLYFWRSRYALGEMARYFLLSMAVYAAFIVPVLFSAGYRRLVLMAEEQGWLFLLQVPYVKEDITLYIVPFVLALLFLRLAYFRTMTRESFIMSLTVAFVILVSLVPPRQGWIFWPLPFLIYFFIKEEAVSRKYYVLVNVFYILHFFVFSKYSDVFHVFQVTAPVIAQMAPPYEMLIAAGFNAQLISDLVFAVFAALLVISAYFVYKNGIISNLEYHSSSVRIGVAGDSGSGKNWLTGLIADLVAKRNMTVLEGDDLHKWERGARQWKIITHLNPKGNNLNMDVDHLRMMLENKVVSRKAYDHSTGRFADVGSLAPGKFTVICGLHAFYLGKMRELLDVKVFMDPDDRLRKRWKILRDMGERSHKKKHILAQIRQRAPDAVRYIHPQKQFADMVLSFSPKGKKAEWKRESIMPLALRVTMDNSFSPSPLIDAFSRIQALRTTLKYDGNARTYSLLFDGDISQQDVAAIAEDIIPHVDGILDNYAPLWHRGYEGIVQLLILYTVAEKLRNKKGRLCGQGYG